MNNNFNPDELKKSPFIESKELVDNKQKELLEIDASILSSIIINGDLSKLNEEQLLKYYNAFCQRIGLDPITKPFDILNLNGKKVIYCTRSGAQQLNKLHKLSHAITSREMVNGAYVVTCRASCGDRFTDSIGAVPITGATGEKFTNLLMKAETKAKRRATLDFIGLGLLDESEIDSIPYSKTESIDNSTINNVPIINKEENKNNIIDITLPIQIDGMKESIKKEDMAIHQLKWVNDKIKQQDFEQYFKEQMIKYIEAASKILTLAQVEFLMNFKFQTIKILDLSIQQLYVLCNELKIDIDRRKNG